MHKRTTRTGLLVVLGAALIAVAAVTAIYAWPGQQTRGTLQSAELPKVRIPGPCDRGATSPFTPTSADISGIAKGLPVVALGRDDNNVPAVPAVGATHTVAYDAPGPQPGAERGLVRLNAHTWPNGAAIGNALLSNFDVGDMLVLRDGATMLCYRVTERVEVDADAEYERYWDLDGGPEFAFIVCSGERTGPGEWSKRTIWWGKPV